jgi:sugar/nucleoside kinase (ribokinase family)
LFNEIDKVLKHPTNNSAAFFLNLCGLSDLYSPDEVRSMFSSLKKQPDIVTGNKEEVSYLSEALGFPPDEVLPNARLLVTTLAEQGSLVRFERDLHHIPAVNVSQETYKNETGCGDAYAGIMLGSLFKEEYNQWSRDQVLSSCKTASFGASLVAQSMDTRLNTQEMAKVKKYHEI